MSYCLGICELYTPRIHGATSNSTQRIIGNYIVVYKTPITEFYNSYYIDMINAIYGGWLYIGTSNGTCNNPYYHPIIRNLGYMVSKPDFIKLDIIQPFYLDGGEMIGIKKTFLLSILQRKWKNIYKKRKDIMELMKHPKHLHMRQVTGKCPK